MKEGNRRLTEQPIRNRIFRRYQSIYAGLALQTRLERYLEPSRLRSMRTA